MTSKDILLYSDQWVFHPLEKLLPAVDKNKYRDPQLDKAESERHWNTQA